MPRVTIAIPTVNRLAYLRIALQSALAQTYANLEVVVSNNASTDGTAEYLDKLRDPRLRVLHQPELLTMVQNWNACVSAATGAYFLLLSDDDLLELDAIAELVQGYAYGDETGTVPGIVYCGGCIVDARGEVMRVFQHSPLRESATDLIVAFFGGKRDLWLCAILFRTADILPGFSSEYSWAPDSLLWIRCVVKYGNSIFIPKELVRYRVHENATAALSLAVWQRELRQLGQFAIEQLQESPGHDAEVSVKLRDEVAKLIIRSTPMRINDALRTRKIDAIREYCRNLHIMASPYGARFLIMGLAFLFLPKQAKPWLRRALKSKPRGAE